jgi:tetratricopeptide (TPR) repeat protein
LRYSHHSYSAGIVVVLALTVGLCSPSDAQRGGRRDEARRQCESGNSNQRLVGCTIVIDAKGFGSKFELATALDARGRAFNDLQQYERGLADCKASIALQPRYSYAYLNLGTSLVGLGDLPNGIAEFTKAIELKPNLIHSYLGRARALAALGTKNSQKKTSGRL